MKTTLLASIISAADGRVKKERDVIMFTWLAQAEGPVLLWIQENLRGALDPIVRLYTHLGDTGMLWIVLSLLMLCYRPTRRAGVTALLAMVLGLLCTNVVLKELVARPRPWLDVAELIPLIQEGDPNSFPSGHTTAAFASASAWWWVLPKRWQRMTGVVLAVGMGFSRMYVGVHYPTDVLAGAAVGVACGWAAWKLTEKAHKRK